MAVDTDVVSFMFKGDTRMQQYAPHLLNKLLVISPMTVAELERWAPDAWVAAVAVLNQIPLVTNNGKHFRGVAGLDVIAANT